MAIGGLDFKLAIDQMPYTGFSLTHSYNNAYTDSAAAATSWATGKKNK
ncbi:alkaline phosphatase [Gammaproteobacteria bacterium]|nr:alkaline phosphatase [Gammaproteobacteria bacterium]